MLSVFSSAAFYGLIGGVGYAGTRLATALWGGLEVGRRARKLAITQFILSLILAPTAAHAFTPYVLAAVHQATAPATGFIVGLAFNAVWPLVTEPTFLRQLIADLARGLASRMTPGAPR